MELIEEVNQLSELLYSQKTTRRWPGRKTISTQNIAEHHSVVGQLCLLLIDRYNIPEEYHTEILRRAITHDLPEVITNDIPYVVKRDFPDFAEAYDKVENKIKEFLPEYLTTTGDKDTIVWHVVKLADTLDVYLFTSAEVDLGTRNQVILDIHEQSVERFKEIERKLIQLLEEGTN